MSAQLSMSHAGWTMKRWLINLRWPGLVGLGLLLFTVGKSLIGWYIGTQGLESTYGAASSIVILLIWVYYSAQIVLFGAELTHAYATQHGSRRSQSATAPSAHKATG